MTAQVEIPTIQTAWRVVRRGTPAKALSFEHDVPVPSTLEEGEVLVKVEAAALNPVGYKMMGLLPNVVARRPFQAAEYDLAGTVALSASSTLAVGTRVFGFIPLALQAKTSQGALTQYTRMPAKFLTRTPDHITSVDAAGTTLAGETAYQALIHEGGLERGQSVFINGGSTSVGAYAIMIAKALDCTVWASASGPNEELVKGLGADHFLDYKKAPLHEALSAAPPTPKFHVIFDAVGLSDPSLYTRSTAYLAPGAKYVTVGPSSGPSSLKELGQMAQTAGAVWRSPCFGGGPSGWKWITLEHQPEYLEELGKMLADGRIKPVVDSVFAFEDALLAYDRIMTGRARGKIVVRIEPEESSHHA